MTVLLPVFLPVCGEGQDPKAQMDVWPEQMKMSQVFSLKCKSLCPIVTAVRCHPIYLSKILRLCVSSGAQCGTVFNTMFSIVLPVCLSTAGSKSYCWKPLPAAADESEQKCEVERNNGLKLIMRLRSHSLHTVIITWRNMNYSRCH